MGMMRKVSVKVEGKERVVEIGDGRVLVDGIEMDVEVIEAEAGVWVLRQGNEQTVAQVDGVGAKMTVEIRRPGADPVAVAAEVGGAQAKPAAPVKLGGATGPVTMRSPIPGRVVKVLVKVDDPVTAGQTVIVLEAMKMENELRAPRAGRVAAVQCTEGTAVEAGQELVVLA
jgi:biotin carboxyl carrier protein